MLQTCNSEVHWKKRSLMKALLHCFYLTLQKSGWGNSWTELKNPHKWQSNKKWKMRDNGEAFRVPMREPHRCTCCVSLGAVPGSALVLVSAHVMLSLEFSSQTWGSCPPTCVPLHLSYLLFCKEMWLCVYLNIWNLICLFWLFKIEIVFFICHRPLWW